MGADDRSQTLVQRKNLENLTENINDKFTSDYATANEHPNPSFQNEMDLHKAELKKLQEIGANTPIIASKIGTDLSFKRKLVWTNIIGFIFLHACAIYGLVITLQGVPHYKTSILSEYLISD